MSPTSHLRQYEQHLRSKALAEKTVTQRVGRMRRLQRDLGDLTAVTQGDVAEWLSAYKGNTRLTYHSDLASIFDWLIDVGERDSHPVRGDGPGSGVKKPPAPAPTPHPLTTADEKRILAAATGDVYTYFLLAFRQGLRAHEIAAIRGRDVNREWITIYGKHGIVADLPTSAAVWERAQEYPRDDAWFNVTPKEVSRRCASLMYGMGFRGGVHRARATYGTRLIENGYSLAEVRELMRHRSLASTQHYLGVSESRLRGAIDSLDGDAA